MFPLSTQRKQKNKIIIPRSIANTLQQCQDDRPYLSSCTVSICNIRTGEMKHYRKFAHFSNDDVCNQLDTEGCLCSLQPQQHSKGLLPSPKVQTDHHLRMIPKCILQRGTNISPFCATCGALRKVMFFCRSSPAYQLLRWSFRGLEHCIETYTLSV